MAAKGGEASASEPNRQAVNSPPRKSQEPKSFGLEDDIVISTEEMRGHKLTNKEAIEAIRANFPPEGYTMLREALVMAIKALGG